ncbi:uncharacterized protein FTOL_03806 [Fusarium torulosum]|uniref:Uncharacterized protein n=1 Tax=Fusarium torulosum TaxID=33205 RepID=A0AAE8M499_9HYPO|nr:uncharacterized protein FTOL_03806 [Fusarium torulosum]
MDWVNKGLSWKLPYGYSSKTWSLKTGIPGQAEILVLSALISQALPVASKAPKPPPVIGGVDGTVEKIQPWAIRLVVWSV